jgi:uncharacterized membrane protein SpoIIM required for sporulation/ABC-type transport system involved in multi-copper enzyme maturation permease subunit
MTEDLRSILLLARRELRDQRRDWRIVVPLSILTVALPVLMSEVARQAVAFFARFGTTLIADRLVPFSILIIGFFPITISLVVALESFVGEKERGTIEPLLNAPLKDWHLYCGKLLVGIVSPLSASYLSIGLYLMIVARQRLQLPEPTTLFLLLTLTTVHALLMVSAALVISVQSTSIRAANLLASFVIIPVALMLQGESVLLFWGTDEVLWLAVLAVIVMAGLIVRLGLAHFQREYLIGRELDELNGRWIWWTFWSAFRGSADGVGSWLRGRVVAAMHALAVPFAIMGAIALIGFWGSYIWTSVHVPEMSSALSQQELRELVGSAQESAGIIELGGRVPAARIFTNNVRATTLLFFSGLVSFSVLGLGIYVLNVALVGGVLAVFGFMGYQPAVLFAAGVLPHGVFEIPALMLVSAAALHIGSVLVTPQAGKSMGQVLLEQLADGAVILIGVVWPLLAIAAVVEAYVTPTILRAALR